MAQTILIDDTYQSADDENVLQIVNSISLKLNGVAAGDDVHPTKTMLIDEMNDIQREICNRRPWIFMNKTSLINGYEATAEGVTEEDFEDYTVEYVNTPTASTYKWAVEYKVDDESIVVPKTITMALGPAIGGLVSCKMNVYIRSSVDGDNLFESEEITVVNSESDTGLLYASSSATETEFTIATNDTLEAGTYYIVLEVVNTPGTSSSMTVGRSTTTTYDNSQYSLDGTNTWTSWDRGLWYTITYDEAQYITDITLPLIVQDIYRMYNTDADNPGANLLRYERPKYVKDPVQPQDTFMMLPPATNGALKVRIKSSVSNVAVWYIDFKTKTTALSSDTDIPLIPSGYRGTFKKQVLYNFLLRGYGMQDNAYIGNISRDIEDGWKSMRKEYLPRPTESFGVARGGGASADVPFYTQEPNRWYVGDGINRPRRL